LAKEVSIRRLLALNKPEWPYMLLGTIMAIFQGAILPFYAIIFGEFLGALSNLDTAQQEANKFSLIFVGIGLGAGKFLMCNETVIITVNNQIIRLSMSRR